MIAAPPETVESARPSILARMAVLTDPTRGRLLRLLERRELSVGDLCAVLQAPQSTVSRHLKVLADGGWLEARRDGTSRFYRLEPESLDPAARQLWELARVEIVVGADAAEDARRLAGVLAARSTRSREFFSSSAGEWDRLRRELFGRHSEVEPLLGLLDEEWTVGDLGCGTASTALALAPYVRRVIAVDSSPEMLAAAGHRLGLPEAPLAENVRLEHGELEALPLADGELDAALLLLVLHHLTDPAAALAEVARSLAAGGRLLVVDMHRHDRREYRSEMGHQWLGFSAEELSAWAAEAGFERPRLRSLPPDPDAKGPPLFALTARRGTGHHGTGPGALNA